MYCATKILLIGDCGDDQQAQRTAITSAEPGWQLDFCESGRAAPDHVRALRPHCIILDNQLPDMSALDCFRAIRDDPGNTMPVLMLTAEDSRSHAAEALKLGLDDYLFKDARGNYLAMLPAVLKKTLRDHRDRLAQRSALESISALSRRFEALFRDLSEGVVLADEEGAIRSLNPAACRLFGVEGRDMCGRPLSLLLRPAGVGSTRAESASGWLLAGGGESLGRHRMTGLPKDSAPVALDVAVTDLAVDGQRLFACVICMGAPPDVSASESGMLTRSAFLADVFRLLRGPAAAGRMHSLMLLRFGRFDDAKCECGRIAGLQLSQQVEALLRRHARKSDRLARLGGGEYALLLTDCAPERAAGIGDKLLDAARSFCFEWGGRRFALDLGIRIAGIDEHTASAGALLERAGQLCAGFSGPSRFHLQVLDSVAAAARQPRAPGRLAGAAGARDRA